MIKEIFPRSHNRYLSLSLFGSTLNQFVQFLSELGYPRYLIRKYLNQIPKIEQKLKKCRCCSIKQVTRKKLKSCAPPPGHSQENSELSAALSLFEKFLDKLRILPPPFPPGPVIQKALDYEKYLREIKGLSPSTIRSHYASILEFLSFLKKNKKFSRLNKLTQQDTEKFITLIGNRVGRGTLQHVVAHLRSFLRFLLLNGELRIRLADQIDTPRVYRAEQLPKTFDWKTVITILDSIDRTTKIGKRDYSMLLLISTYGLRISEIINLKANDIDWRNNRIQIFQPKTCKKITLPLTEDVANSIVDYLRQGRPPARCREIFVRHYFPIGALKRTAVTEAFKAWTRRSGLSVQPRGAHCLRHSYAVHLLRNGTPLKTIGDILGHVDSESTCVYLRLNIEDLRTVPLSLPTTPN